MVWVVVLHTPKLATTSKSSSTKQITIVPYHNYHICIYLQFRQSSGPQYTNVPAVVLSPSLL